MSLDRYVGDLWAYAQTLGYDRVDASRAVDEVTAGGFLGLEASLVRKFAPGKELYLLFWSTRLPGMAARLVLDVPGEGFDEGRVEGDRKFLREMMGKSG